MATRYMPVKMVVLYFVKEQPNIQLLLLPEWKMSGHVSEMTTQVTKANRMNHLQQNTISGDLQPLGRGRRVHLRIPPPHVSTFLMRRHESFYPQTALGFLFSRCKQNCWLFSLSSPILTRPHYPWATHKYAVEGKVFPYSPEACCHSKNDCWCFHHAFVVWSCKLCLCSFFFFCCAVT